MSALESVLSVPADLPRIYLACPLTGLSDAAIRHIKSDTEAVKIAVEQVTSGDRLDSERWPVSIYAPIDYTAPWCEDGLSPAEVYRKNLTQVHSSDALIVIAEGGGSAGIGQELEWSVRLGLPTLYLSPDHQISRQIAGVPGYVRAQTYSCDVRTLRLHVQNFLRQSRPLILDGPRRRASRELRYEVLTRRLRHAWASCSDRTVVAAQIRVDLAYLEVTLSDPAFVSMMPAETLIALANELDVRLTDQVLALSVAEMRALMAAAERQNWSDSEVGRLVFHGHAAREGGDEIDLRVIDGWIHLRRNL